MYLNVHSFSFPLLNNTVKAKGREAEGEDLKEDCIWGVNVSRYVSSDITTCST